MFKIAILIAAIALSLVLVPSFWVNVFILVDFYTPWILFESKLYDQYHQFLISRLEEREEQPVIEITPAEANAETLFKLSKGYTWPIIIRGMLADAPGISTWNSSKWWREGYGSEPVLCGTLSNVVEDCTISTFFDAIDEGKPFYISGASVIFDRNENLIPMIDNEHVRSLEPGNRMSTQIFMGVPKMGSDIHSAMGINVFRQIVGQKKWWFIPPHQTAYLKPSINVNGFSSHTHTLVGKEQEKESAWLNKIERYTAVLNPGDVLINPPWFWHGIINLGSREDNDLVVGSPSRYSAGHSIKAALRSNFMFTLNALVTVGRQYGLKAFNPDFKINLQGDIANNRRFREKKELVGHPLDEA